MASKQMLAVAAAAVALAVLLPARGAAATEHMVGDGNGWILGFDYAAWAATKQFRVGDTLGNGKASSPPSLSPSAAAAAAAACTRSILSRRATS